MSKAIRIASAAAGLALAVTFAPAPIGGTPAEGLANHAAADSSEKSMTMHQTSRSASRSARASASASAHASSSSKAKGSGARCASESGASVEVDGTRRIVRESRHASENGACSSSSKISLGMDSGDAARDGLDGRGAAPSARTDRSDGEASD